jgi:D-alanyl-D-alanine carboxypeptidase
MSAAGLAVVALLVQVTLLGPSDRPASAALDRDETTSAYMRELATKTGVPGLAWAVIEDGAVATGMLGTDGDGDPIKSDTPFLWGSVAKPVTATAVMQLVERGRIGLDDPIVDHVPWLPVHGRDGTEVTIRHLLNHTSGFSTQAGLALADRARSGLDAIRTVTRSLAARMLVAEPGEEHRYSAINFLVLGALVEEVTDQPFARRLARQVLAPAGMTDAIVTAEQAADRLPPGHRLAFGRAWSFDGPYDEAGLPFGYLGGTLDDGTALVRTLLDDAHPARRAGLLDVQTLEQMWQARVAAAGASYGLGWRTDTHPDVEEGSDTDVRLVWHSGATPGYFATVLMAPEDDLGIVVLANGYSLARDAQLNEAAFDLLRIRRGDPPAPAHPDRLLLLLPWLLLVVAAAPPLAAFSRLRRRRSVSARRGTCWLLGLGFVGCVARFGLPAVTGQEWRTIILWTPGVAAGVRAVLIGCLLAAVVVLGGFVRSRAHHRGTS